MTDDSVGIVVGFDDVGAAMDDAECRRDLDGGGFEVPLRLFDVVDASKLALRRPMSTCKDCRHSTVDREYERWKKVGYLVCLHPKWMKGYTVETSALPADGVHVENDEDWGFRVGPDFGCVHFEKRDVEEPGVTSDSMAALPVPTLPAWLEAKVVEAGQRVLLPKIAPDSLESLAAATPPPPVAEHYRPLGTQHLRPLLAAGAVEIILHAVDFCDIRMFCRDKLVEVSRRHWMFDGCHIRMESDAPVGIIRGRDQAGVVVGEIHMLVVFAVDL